MANKYSDDRKLTRARNLAAKIARKLLPGLVPSGYVYKPKRKKQRIPIKDALLSPLTYSEVITWDHGSLYYQAVADLPLYKGRMSVMDCLTHYCVTRYGRDHGRDVLEDVIAHVLTVSSRDLRQSKYHHETNRSKPHRKSKRFRKPTFFKLERYWEWLLKLSTQRHNAWRRTQREFPATGLGILEQLESS